MPGGVQTCAKGMPGSARRMQGCAWLMQGCTQGCGAAPGGCGSVSGGCGAMPRARRAVPRGCRLVPGVLQPLGTTRGRTTLSGCPSGVGGPQAGSKPGGARARLARRVGFPAALVMNLHEPSVSTRRQSMAESTGVNKCLYNEGRGERTPPRRPPLLGPGGKD